MTTKSLILVILTMIISVGFAYAQSETSEDYAFQRAIEEYRKGEAASAIEWFNKEIKDHPKNGYAYIYLATIHYQVEEYGKALTTINSAIANLPKKDKAMGAVALGYKGDIMVALRDTVGAIMNYEQALKLNPENVRIYVNRGNLYYAQDNFILWIGLLSVVAITAIARTAMTNQRRCAIRRYYLMLIICLCIL